MTGFRLPWIEDLAVEDLARLPEQYRYELHEGNLVVLLPTTFWHKTISVRLLSMLGAAGLDVFSNAGIHGDRPRDFRSPDLGVVLSRPQGFADCYTLPGSAFGLVVEILDEGAACGEGSEKFSWYAERGIPEYWIVSQPPDRADDDALVRIYRLTTSPGGGSAYVAGRSLLLSALEDRRGAVAQLVSRGGVG